MELLLSPRGEHGIPFYVHGGTGFYTVYAALPAGDPILANIEKMVAMARASEENGNFGGKAKDGTI